MDPLPDPQDVGLQSPITGTVIDRYVASEPQAVDFTLICSYCSFLIHLGHGPVLKETCNLCKLECFPEVAND